MKKAKQQPTSEEKSDIFVHHTGEENNSNNILAQQQQTQTQAQAQLLNVTTAALPKHTFFTSTGSRPSTPVPEEQDTDEFVPLLELDSAEPGDCESVDENSEYAINTLRVQLSRLLERFQSEVPLFSPFYIGHMVSDISLPALLGALVTLVHNPNQVTMETSRVGIQVEQEALLALCKMFGFEDLDACTGHFTSGGTVANFEGLARGRFRMADWIAMGALARTQGVEMGLFEASAMGWKRFDELSERFLSGLDETERRQSLKPYHLLHSDPYVVANNLARIFQLEHGFRCPIVLVPGSKHYSWQKACPLFGLGDDAFWSIETDHEGKLSMYDLRAKFAKAVREERPIISIVTIAGTTELSDFDPVDEVVEFIHEQERKGIHLYHHVDAAYGGFFVSMICEEPSDWQAPQRSSANFDAVLSPRLTRALDAIKYANSITIDPHKLGYTPYSSGCFLVRDSREYRCFESDKVAAYLMMERASRGAESIEGSRSAAGAVSCWITSNAIGLHRSGYGLLLKRLIWARQVLDSKLSSVSKLVRVCQHNQTNITCFCLARDGEPVHLTNRRTVKFFEAFSPFNQAATFVTSQTTFHWDSYSQFLDNFVGTWNGHCNTEGLMLIRCVIMNPFFAKNGDHMDSFVSFVKQRVEEIELEELEEESE